MIKILNGMLNVLKMIMLLVCFVFSFYIIINMYQRLDKNIVGAIANFIPFFLLFILFSINFIFKQESVNQNTFYNITCILAFLMLGFAIYRTLFDKNMIIMIRMGYNINFNYFADIIAPMRIFLYSLSAANILLMISGANLEKFFPNVNNIDEEPQPIKKKTIKKTTTLEKNKKSTKKA